jgi:hypothetical protein
MHRSLTHTDVKHCRWTTAAFFAGTGANGLLGSANGVMLSWGADNTMLWGMGDGYASWGVQYCFVNIPPVGTQIPVALAFSNVTRTVTQIGSRRYIPLGVWEALYWIPPSNIGGTSSAAGDFVIGYYTGNHAIPAGAVLIAKLSGTTGLNGQGQNKTRVLFGDGTYVQPGLTFASATPAEYDQAHQTAEWQNVTVAGQTPPGGAVALPTVVGVLGNYPAPYAMQYRKLSLDDDPRGTLQIKGLIQLNASVTGAANIAFIPGAQVYGQPVIMGSITSNTLGDPKTMPCQLRLINGGLGSQNGVFIQSGINAMDVNLNPFFTLGVNGGASPAGTPSWVSLGEITVGMI